MYRLLIQSLRTGVVTGRDDEEGTPFPVIDLQRCNACGACADVCPTGAVRVEPPDGQPARLELSYAACLSCGECVTACTAGAVRPVRGPALAAYTRAQLTVRATFAVDAAGTVQPGVADPGDGPSLAESAARLRARIHGLLGRSLHVRQVDAGSCNGCELEIAAATQPLYDLERFGVHLVASPRHADLLLVTGPVTRNMETALRRTYEATPEPRIVVAIGACGCTGGIFGEDTYAVRGGVDRVLPVDLYVPGCPPRPQAIVNALLVAMDVREARAHVQGDTGPRSGRH